MSSDLGSVPYLIHIIRANRPRSIIDVGAGYGKMGVFIRLYCEKTGYIKSDWGLKVDAVEVYSPYLENTSHFYDKVYYEDFRKLAIRGYDIVLLLDILEHLEKENAIFEVKRLNEQNKSLMITTPNGFMKQKKLHNNKYQIHRCGFKKEDFEQLNLRTLIYRGKLFAFSKNLRFDLPLYVQMRRRVVPNKVREIIIQLKAKRRKIEV